MNICSKCNKQVKTNDLKICSKCNSTYHFQCLGIPADNFSKESKSYKANWKCSECKSTDKRGGNSNSPHRPVGTTSPAADCEDLKQYIDKKLDESLSRLLRDIRRDFAEENSGTRSIIQELTDSVNFMSSKCDELKADLDVKTKKIGNLELENSSLRSQVTDLSAKLNQLEQQSRDCNLEIQNVPEFKAENLKTTIQQLVATVGCVLPENELINYHRVAKINQTSNRPRSIIVKLPSPLVRDKILAAVKTFNRTHQDNKLNSSHLGLAGEQKPVYVCEHLSPTNKQLHAAARKVSKDKNVQFVWVRNGRIYMRKDITSKSFVVKDLDFLNSLKFD
ncbi:unnamed protein product [Colias eurytheme]|nr:unnamed protein product [Colias eurytheme]